MARDSIMITTNLEIKATEFIEIADESGISDDYRITTGLFEEDNTLTEIKVVPHSSKENNYTRWKAKQFIEELNNGDSDITYPEDPNEPEIPEPDPEPSMKVVTSFDDIQSEDKVIIFAIPGTIIETGSDDISLENLFEAGNDFYVMGNLSSSPNNAMEAKLINSYKDLLSDINNDSSDISKLTVGINGNSFSLFIDSDGRYLYYQGSSNFLSCRDDVYNWILTENSNSLIISPNENSEKSISLNISTSPIFRVYNNTSTASTFAYLLKI